MSIAEPTLPSGRERQGDSSLRRIVFIAGEADGEVAVPAEVQSLDAFRAWATSEEFPDRWRLTFVDHELIVDMSPESFELHSEIKTEVARVLGQLVRERRLGNLHIDGVLISNPDAGVSNEPDAVFVRRGAEAAGEFVLTPYADDPRQHIELVGAVDWVLEIVSRYSGRKDKVQLRQAYYDAGISEYWIIDAQGEEIEFEILVPGDGQYVSVKSVEGWRASPTFGAEFRLTYEEDEAGFWLYTLEIRQNP